MKDYWRAGRRGVSCAERECWYRKNWRCVCYGHHLGKSFCERPWRQMHFQSRMFTNYTNYIVGYKVCFLKVITSNMPSTESTLNVCFLFLEGRQEPMERWEFCIQATAKFFNFGLGSLYERSPNRYKARQKNSQVVSLPSTHSGCFAHLHKTEVWSDIPWGLCFQQCTNIVTFFSAA